MEPLNPITLLDRHSWVPAIITILFGSAWLRRKEKGELLTFRTGNSTLLKHSLDGRLKASFNGKEVDNLQIFILFFENKGRLIDGRELLIQCSPGEILDCELREIPEHENWEIQHRNNQIKIGMKVLKPKEQFSLVLYTQNAKKDGFQVDSRSELKIQNANHPDDVSTYQSGYKDGFRMCTVALGGGGLIEMAKQIETQVPTDPVFGPLILPLKIIGWGIIIFALLAFFVIGYGLHELWQKKTAIKNSV